MGFMTKEMWMGLSLIMWLEHMLVISNLLIFSQLREFMKEMNKLNNAEASKSLDYMKQELNEEVIKKKGSNKKRDCLNCYHYKDSSLNAYCLLTRLCKVDFTVKDIIDGCHYYMPKKEENGK